MGSIREVTFLDQLSDYQLLKDSAPCYILGPNILLRTLFFSLNCCSFIRMGDQVSRPYKIKGKRESKVIKFHRRRGCSPHTSFVHCWYGGEQWPSCSDIVKEPTALNKALDSWTKGLLNANYFKPAHIIRLSQLRSGSPHDRCCTAGGIDPRRVKQLPLTSYTDCWQISITKSRFNTWNTHIIEHWKMSRCLVSILQKTGKTQRYFTWSFSDNSHNYVFPVNVKESVQSRSLEMGKQRFNNKLEGSFLRNWSQIPRLLQCPGPNRAFRLRH
jgi:hypothetical protein